MESESFLALGRNLSWPPGELLLTFISSLYVSARLRSEKWMNVQVGDIIKLENNQFVTVSMKVVEDDEKVVGVLSEQRRLIVIAARQSSCRFICVLIARRVLRSVSRRISCCCPAVSLSIWSMWRRLNWTGESS